MKRLNEGLDVKLFSGEEDEILYAGTAGRPMKDFITVRLDITYYAKENKYKSVATGEFSDASSFEISYDTDAIEKVIKEAIEERVSKVIGEKVVAAGSSQMVGFANLLQNWR